MLPILLTLKKLIYVVSNQAINLQKRFSDKLEQIVLQ
jgi:hypothetical protein